MRSRSVVSTLTVLLTSFASCACVPAQTVVTLNPARDATLYQDAAGALANGSGTSFFCGLNNMNGVRRGVLVFDVAGGVPFGAAICWATLRLDMVTGGTSALPVSLHRVNADWGEGASVAGGSQGGGGPAAPGDATWIHTFSPGSFWAAAGGDFAAAASSTTTVSVNATYTWTGLAADVQSMLDAPLANFGWMLKCPETLAGTVKGFATRESTSAVVRPRLEIGYRPFTVASTLNLGGGCPSSNLTLGAAGVPTIGLSSFAVLFSSGPANGAASLYLASSNGPYVILPNGCAVALDLASVLAFVNAGASPVGPIPLDSSGAGSLPAPVPTDPCLVGITIAIQAVATNPLIPGAFVLSNGLHLTVGL